MPRERITAKIGPLTFNGDFPDPIVDVKSSAQIAEHETIDGENIVQIMGESPRDISVEGVIYEDQLPIVDNLTSKGEVEVYTQRWTGMAVVDTVDTGYRREADPETGKWAYDVAIDLIGITDWITTGGSQTIEDPDREAIEQYREYVNNR